MKILLLPILLSLALSFEFFNNQAVVSYAKKWCNSTNPYYNYYKGEKGGDASNFVSQCLMQGGINFSGCKTDSKGSVSDYYALKKCLIDMGWHYSRFVPKEFKAGYPVLYGNIIAIATYVNGKDIKVCTHANSFLGSEYPSCDVPLMTFGESVYFYI